MREAQEAMTGNVVLQGSLHLTVPAGKAVGRVDDIQAHRHIRPEQREWYANATCCEVDTTEMQCQPPTSVEAWACSIACMLDLTCSR